MTYELVYSNDAVNALEERDSKTTSISCHGLRGTSKDARIEAHG